MNTLNSNINLRPDNITNFLGMVNKSHSKEYVDSDEYLDTISDLNKALDGWIYEIEKINNFIETNFPKSKRNAVGYLNSILKVYGGLKTAMTLLNDEDSKKAHGSRILLIEEQLTQLEEYIIDIQTFRINRPDSLVELDELLNNM